MRHCLPEHLEQLDAIRPNDTAKALKLELRGRFEGSTEGEEARGMIQC